MLKINTFRSLKNRGFRLYMVGMLGQMAAMNMEMVVRSLMVYRITGSATAIGIMAASGTLPHIVSSLYGGVIADRMEKKYVLTFSLAGFSALAFGIAISLTTGWLNERTWWIIVLYSVGLSTVVGLMIPARHSIIPELVGIEQVMNAVSLSAVGMNGWRLMAPAAAGFLVEGFGFEAVYYIIGSLYIWAFIFTAFLPRTSKLVETSKNALTEIAEGFKYLRSEPSITWVLVFNLFAVILALPHLHLLPVFVDDILKVGAGGMGILVSFSGIGAIFGSLILASLPNQKRGLMLLSSTLFLGLMLIVFSFSKSWGLSLGVMVLIGLGQTGRFSLSNTLAQNYSSDKFRGRVMGIFDMQMSFPGLAVYAAGVLTGIIGIEWAIGSLAMMLVAFSLLVMIMVPQLRKLD
jgi:MFS family permease